MMQGIDIQESMISSEFDPIKIMPGIESIQQYHFQEWDKGGSRFNWNFTSRMPKFAGSSVPSFSSALDKIEFAASRVLKTGRPD
jgi:hypothetical protein